MNLEHHFEEWTSSTAWSEFQAKLQQNFSAREIFARLACAVFYREILHEERIICSNSVHNQKINACFQFATRYVEDELELTDFYVECLQTFKALRIDVDEKWNGIACRKRITVEPFMDEMWTVPLRSNSSTSRSEQHHLERRTPEVTPPDGQILLSDDFPLQDVSTSETSQSYESFDECKPSTAFSYDIRPEVMVVEPEVIPMEPEAKPIFSQAEPTPGPSHAYHEEHQLADNGYDMHDDGLQRLLDQYGMSWNDPQDGSSTQPRSEFRGERSLTKFGKPALIYRLPNDPDYCYLFCTFRDDWYRCCSCMTAKRQGEPGSIKTIKVEGDTFMSDPSIGHMCNFANDASCKYEKCRSERHSYTVNEQLRKMKERPQDLAKTIIQKDSHEVRLKLRGIPYNAVVVDGKEMYRCAFDGCQSIFSHKPGFYRHRHTHIDPSNLHLR